MNDAPLSVLLLAWDDADPTPAALNAGLPTGAAFRKSLAAHVHLTAILPYGAVEHVAAPENTVSEPDTAAATSASQPASPATPPPGPQPALGLPSSGHASNATSPGRISVLKMSAAASWPTRSAIPDTPPQPRERPQELADATVASAFTLAELQPTALLIPQPALNAPVTISLADFTLSAFDAEAQRRGSPMVTAVPHHGLLAPAAPYIGSSLESGAYESISQIEAETKNPALRLSAESESGAANPAASGTTPVASSQHTHPAEAQRPTSAPSQQRMPVPEGQEEEFEAEPGPAESSDLTQWEDDLTLAHVESSIAASATTARAAALAALRQPASPTAPEPTENYPSAIGDETGPPETEQRGLLARTPDLSADATAAAAATAALSFRIIQYARFATQLVGGDGNTQVIFAGSWPTWLAAVEMRQRTGKPLVAYLDGLPSARAPRRAQGWLQAMEQQILRYADLVLVPDAAFGLELAGAYALRQPPQVLASPLAPAADVPSASTLAATVAALLPVLQAATALRA